VLLVAAKPRTLERMPLRVRGSLAGAALLLSACALAAGGCSSSRPSEELATRHAGIICGSLDTTHRGVVSLLRQVEGGFYPACSGTLLTRNLVLTAHHCVASLTSKDGESVACGQTEFGPPERASNLLISIEANVGREGLDPFGVAEVWLPPDAGSGVCGNDIALLRLSGSGIAGSLATPIEPRLTSEVRANDVFAAIGYGLQDPNDQEGRTLGRRMSVDDAQVYCTGIACRSPMVKDNEWIADSPICSGDSGGPALDQNGRVSGITSRGDPECTVAIYTSVYAWRDFIRDSVFEAATLGHYDPPAWAGDAPPGYDPGTVEPVGGTGSLGSGGTNTGGGSSTGGALSSGGSGSSLTIDPLGLSCTGHCPGSYLCWSGDGQPPGICVPACGDGQRECPADYSCSADLGACIPTAASGDSSAADSGCSVRGVAPRAGSDAAWLGLALLGLVATRRGYARARR
jgi:hypothetical protein